MQLEHLSLREYRSYRELDLDLGPGTTALVGANGEGKSNLLEAVAYLADLASFRGAPPDALVRHGASRAVVRGRVRRAGRELLIEAEIPVAGRGQVLVNRQRLTRRRDLLAALQVTVFSPDDLELVKGGPRGRRQLLDGGLVATDPANDARRSELDRVLRQRNALLKQARGRVTPDVATTLEVWDSKLVEMGEDWGRRRQELVRRLADHVASAYLRLSGGESATLSYEPAWLGRLPAALGEVRDDELRRGVSLVGPHRDELDLSIAGLPARTHRSQGEQRSLALALRLGLHLLLTEVHDAPPVLLLDDVFSELDTTRSRALVAMLPGGQTLLTTAGPIPDGVVAEQILVVAGSEISVAPAGWPDSA